MRLITCLPIFLSLGCATKTDLKALQAQNDLQSTQIELLEGRLEALEQRPTYIEEVTTLSDLVELGCTKGAQTYETQMANRSIKSNEARHGDLCAALRSDVMDGLSQCNPVALACESTLCKDLGSRAPQLGCYALGLNEPWSSYGMLRPPALVSNGRIRHDG